MEQKRIEEKIVNLKETIEYIKKITQGNKKEILVNRLIIDSLENNLRKAIQIMIDLASDVVSKNKLGMCSTYYQTFEKLVENGYLSSENLEMYKKMIGTRNRIVHDYDRVSNEILYRIATERLDDFNIFINDLFGSK